MRILGIDAGTKRTGVAVSDPLGITCTPLPVLRERDEKGVLLRIAAIADEYGVGEIVVGLPRPLAGGANQQMETVLAFVEDLAGLTSVPVRTWDERFTSKLAEAAAGRQGEADSVAACYMLQDYLEWRSKRPGGDDDE